MNTMEGMRRGAPATTITLAAVLLLSGCSAARETVPTEVASFWEDVERGFVDGDGLTPQQRYEEAALDGKKISVDVADLDRSERAAAVANAVFAETGNGDTFRATSVGVVDGEDTVRMELGNTWPWDETFTTRQLEATSALVCTSAVASGEDSESVAQAVRVANEQTGEAAKEARLQVTLGCVALLIDGDSKDVELDLVVPIGQ